ARRGEEHGTVETALERGLGLQGAGESLDLAPVAQRRELDADIARILYLGDHFLDRGALLRGRVDADGLGGARGAGVGVLEIEGVELLERLQVEGVRYDVERVVDDHQVASGEMFLHKVGEFPVSGSCAGEGVDLECRVPVGVPGRFLFRKPETEGWSEGAAQAVAG